ncbi:MAG: 1-deoxy-D-xylulose-5-phosphate reductoisomerase [Clostridia bacterium]|nr:1-deoxy-D-xylulose-5-phosphate reductoisomerase [Clostridia bacterium]MDE6356604.1 1-deoxy-D-xylulose-5-phosphate reductoisomerase [Clostridia bacterium]
MKKIALIGSTGSIGRQVLEVVRGRKDLFKIVALAAQNPSEEFNRQVREFKPEYSALASQNAEAALKAAEIESADLVFNAATGFAGLEYSVRALKAGKNLALANKETLVCGGELITRLAKTAGKEIIPVDSEHSAIWQCLNFDRKADFKKLVITASGGAFRGKKWEDLKSVTPEQALNHPTWQMGKKITVDSATLLNKGYEVIEAHVLFNAPYSKIETVIQPQSIVHSLVEFKDGAVIAQMGTPTMEVPIRLALTYPQRLAGAVKPLSFKNAFSVEFQPLKAKDYPLYALAMQAAKEGGTLPCALNAADEVAVKAFLDKKIAFTDILTVVESVLAATPRDEAVSLKQLAEVDSVARWKAQKLIFKLR